MAPSPTPYVAWGVQVEPEQPTPIPPETAAPQQTEAQQLITASGSLGVLTVGRKEIPIAGNVEVVSSIFRKMVCRVWHE